MKLQYIRYHLPDATTNSIPTEYIEETEERGGDAAKWEAEQIYAAMLKYGAKDAKSVYFLLVFLLHRHYRELTNSIFFLTIKLILFKLSKCLVKTQEKKKMKKRCHRLKRKNKQSKKLDVPFQYIIFETSLLRLSKSIKLVLSSNLCFIEYLP